MSVPTAKEREFLFILDSMSGQATLPNGMSEHAWKLFDALAGKGYIRVARPVQDGDVPFAVLTQKGADYLSVMRAYAK